MGGQQMRVLIGPRVIQISGQVIVEIQGVVVTVVLRGPDGREEPDKDRQKEDPTKDFSRSHFALRTLLASAATATESVLEEAASASGLRTL